MLVCMPEGGYDGSDDSGAHQTVSMLIDAEDLGAARCVYQGGVGANAP